MLPVTSFCIVLLLPTFGEQLCYILFISFLPYCVKNIMLMLFYKYYIVEAPFSFFMARISFMLQEDTNHSKQGSVVVKMAL